MESNKNVTEKADLRKHLLNEHCRKYFKKIRIRKKYIRPSKADKLLNERTQLLKNNTEFDSDKIKDLDKKIGDIIADEERDKCLKFK